MLDPSQGWGHGHAGFYALITLILRMPITTRRAEMPEDRQHVFRFPCHFNVEGMGRVQTYADHDARSIIEPVNRIRQILMAEN